MRYLTVELDDDLYGWLLMLPDRAGDGFACSANEAVVTSLRCLKGELPLAHLAVIAARVQGVTLAEATFGPCRDKAQADDLLKAAERAAMGFS